MVDLKYSNKKQSSIRIKKEVEIWMCYLSKTS